MPAISIQPTYPVFTGLDGLPLDAGYLWFGVANLDPQTNPTTIYWDEAMTIVAPQPVRTLAGYPSRSGTPARIFIATDYSVRVQDSKGVTVYNASSQLLATTDFVNSAISTATQALYPVGSIYINAGVTTNPATLLGFGTWEAFGAGRVLVGLNGSDTLFDALEETGGSKDAVVVSHNHTATSTSTVADPGHVHAVGLGSSFAGNVYVQPTVNALGVTLNTEAATTGITVTTSTTNTATGASGTNANLQPYITVAMWKRTA